MSRIRKSSALIGGLLAVLLATPGCGDDKKKSEQDPAAGAASGSGAVVPKNDCKSVGEHLAELTRHKFQGLEGRKKKIMRTQLQLVREQFIKTCSEENWPAEIRTCMTAATDIGAFNACTAPLRKERGMPPPAIKPGKTGVPSQPGVQPGAPKPPAPAPTAPTPPAVPEPGR